LVKQSADLLRRSASNIAHASADKADEIINEEFDLWKGRMRNGGNAEEFAEFKDAVEVMRKAGKKIPSGTELFEPEKAVEILEKKYGLVYDGVADSWKKGDVKVFFGNGRWVYKKGDHEVAEFFIKAPHGDVAPSVIEGKKTFFQSHHGFQDKWAEERLLKYGYDYDDPPTLLLRDSHAGSPH
jgi:hypothetical protein